MSLIHDTENTISTLNSRATATLAAGATFQGEGEDVSKYGRAGISISSSNASSGVLTIEVSRDGVTWSGPTRTVSDARYAQPHMWNIVEKYFRIKYVNGSTTANDLVIQTQYSVNADILLGHQLDETLLNETEAIITRSVLVGKTDGGDYNNVPVTQEGHLEVAIHSPRLPFGAIHTENLTPLFQTDPVYGINSGQVSTFTSLSGGATAADSLFVVSTGTTATAQGVILGRKRLRYRPGQGVVGRFTALYTTPVSYSYQIAGFGHAEDGVYLGYREATGNGYSGVAPAFGILYITRGVRETQTLTVTAGATSASNVTITLNSVAFTVAVTNSSNIQRTVYEISQGTFTGWDAYPSGATVIFVKKSVGANAGTFSFNAGTTGSAASIVQTKAGAAANETFIPQSTWNGDKLDGTGASGVTLDPTKGNVYQIGIQYLGFGSIVFQIEATPTDANNSDFVTVHTMKLPNTLSTTSFGNPSFPFTMAAYSAGSTTNLSVKAGSFAGFVEGSKTLHGNRFSYFNQLTTVGAANYQALFTVLNTRYYQGRANQAVINLLSVSGALKHSSPTIFYLIRGGTLAGNPNFIQLASNSCSLWDTAATTVTYSTGDQLLWTGHLGDTGEIDHHFGNGTLNAEEVTLQPGEWITLAAKSTTGTPAYVTGSMNTREDQ